MKRLLLASVCVLSACQNYEPARVTTFSTPTPASAPAAKQLSPKEAACEVAKKTHTAIETQYTVELQTVAMERHFQRVVRKTCGGAPISDKIETVKSAHADVTLVNPVKAPFVSVFVFSETTCDHKLTSMPVADSFVEKATLGWMYNVHGDGKKQITLKGDVANALLTFELAPGRNNIYVDFHMDCAPTSDPGNNNARVGAGTCIQSLKTVKALFPVEIKYTEKTLEGAREIKQDEKGAACEKPA